MAGLLDQFGEFLNTPGGMGLLSAVGAGLAGARRGQPLNAFGAGLLGGVHGYNQAQEQAMQKRRFDTLQQMSDLQVKQAQQAQADQDAIRGLAKSSYTAPSMTMNDVMSAPGAAGPTMDRAQLLPKTQGTFDTNGFINGVMGINPLEGIKMRASLAKESQFDKFKPENYTPQSVAQAMQTGDYSKLVRQDKLHFADNGGGIVGLNPFTGAQVSSSDKTGDPFTDLVVRDPATGKLVPNQPLVGAKTSIAQAGAAKNNVSVNTAQNPFFQGIGQFGAEQFKTSTAGAQEAAKRIEQNKTISDLLGKNVFTGGGADYKLAIGKAAQAVGLNFDNDAVKNTELLASQLANRTLNSIKSSGLGAGQGFSNADRDFLQQAVGGSITLNNGTLRRLVELDNRAARTTIQKHNKMVKPVQDAAALQGFPMDFGVPEPQFDATSAAPAASDAQSDLDALVNKHRTKGGR